jgi:hypothetical protein
MSGVRNPVFDSIRIIPKEDAFLDRKLGSRGEVFFDQEKGTLRLYNGTVGGITLLRDDLSNIKSGAINVSFNLGSGTLTASQFIGIHTGNVVGNVTGNLTGNSAGVHTGNVVGNVTGDLTGNSAGVHTGNVVGNVTGNLTGNVNGNSSTATTLENSRTINGVNFNGSSNITVTAAANTLSGTTINSSVVTSNLNTVGTLNNLTVAGDVIANSNVVIETTPTNSNHASNKKYVDSRAIAFGVAMS